MANPRKFSEKIALHNQKQAEETLAFEQIMREVSDATSKENLLASALSNMEELSPSNRESPMFTRDQRGRSPGVGPIRSRPIEKRLDTSPYSGAYLSPPPDTSWRRTNSDSALHQSALTLSPDNSLHSPGSQRRGRMHGDHHQGQHLMMMGDGRDQKHLMVSQDGRPRSYCEVPRVPGINIYPSQHEPGTIQIPIGNNTGSLPDLTSFHFPSPLPTPLDQEELSTSPYSVSSQNASPSTLSPTSLSSRPMGRFPFGSPHHQAESPGHSPGSRRRQYPQQHLENLVIGPHSPTNTQNHLSVPVNSRYLHTCKGVTLDNSGQAVQIDSFQQNQYTGNIYNQTVQTSNSQNIPTHHMSSLGSYRNPAENRPSPMNSPGLTVQSGLYRSSSPGLTNHSGPQSPVSPASSPGIGSANNPFSDNTNYFISQAQANALQQHFEQFSMLDNPVSTSTGMNYIGSQSNSMHYSQAASQDDCLSLVGSQELSTDPGYYSQSPSSQMHFTQQSGINPSGGSTQQTTPQTPTSIPDIILTDFSSGGDNMSRQEFVKDLGCAMSGSFDTDLFPSDESLREGLDPIDFDGLQMLTDPDMNVITDPSTEDNFRMDRL